MGNQNSVINSKHWKVYVREPPKKSLVQFAHFHETKQEIAKVDGRDILGVVSDAVRSTVIHIRQQRHQFQTSRHHHLRSSLVEVDHLGLRTHRLVGTLHHMHDVLSHPDAATMDTYRLRLRLEQRFSTEERPPSVFFETDLVLRNREDDWTPSSSSFNDVLLPFAREQVEQLKSCRNHLQYFRTNESVCNPFDITFDLKLRTSMLEVFHAEESYPVCTLIVQKGTPTTVFDVLAHRTGKLFARWLGKAIALGTSGTVHVEAYGTTLPMKVEWSNTAPRDHFDVSFPMGPHHSFHCSLGTFMSEQDLWKAWNSIPFEKIPRPPKYSQLWSDVKRYHILEYVPPPTDDDAPLRTVCVLNRHFRCVDAATESLCNHIGSLLHNHWSSSSAGGDWKVSAEPIEGTEGDSVDLIAQAEDSSWYLVHLIHRQNPDVRLCYCMASLPGMDHGRPTAADPVVARILYDRILERTGQESLAVDAQRLVRFLRGTYTVLNTVPVGTFFALRAAVQHLSRHPVNDHKAYEALEKGGKR